MVFKVFIDANVLLDFTLKRANYVTSKMIIELTINNDIKVFITPAIVHIVAYWLKRSYGKKKAKELVLSFLLHIKVIDATHEVTIHALHSKMEDIEDALPYFTAMHYKMDYFLTWDKHFIKQALPELPLYLPGEFLTNIL